MKTAKTAMQRDRRSRVLHLLQLRFAAQDRRCRTSLGALEERTTTITVELRRKRPRHSTATVASRSVQVRTKWDPCVTAAQHAVLTLLNATLWSRVKWASSQFTWKRMRMMASSQLPYPRTRTRRMTMSSPDLPITMSTKMTMRLWHPQALSRRLKAVTPTTTKLNRMLPPRMRRKRSLLLLRLKQLKKKRFLNLKRLLLLIMWRARSR
mmetsp:Transcript_8047/g.15980  ORF Transcript_8047/g.15980 Transcript_8047/m.15980 type:complete len:209 (+) Transcript_8047:365-991(+)